MKSFLLSILALWASKICLVKVDAVVQDRQINIFNKSGARVEIFWIHPQTGEGVLQSSPFIHNGANMNLNSYSSHSFEAREMPRKSGGCGGEDNVCRIGYFTVNSNQEQAVHINADFLIIHKDDQTMAEEEAGAILKSCVDLVKENIKANNLSASNAVDAMENCVEGGVANELKKSNEEISFQTLTRRSMGEHFENYTCADFELNSTEAIEQETWADRDNLYHDVDILLDRPSAKIHVVKDFISADECKAMEDAAAPLLHQATVADGKGGSHFSENRKAMQAGIKIPWNFESKGNLLTKLSRRVYDYTNHVLDMDIDEFGQEDLMSIQYEGRGIDDEAPDRYTPHCDGDCDGSQHKDGNRMATMVIYCTIPEIGGATNFRDVGLHIVPKPGYATFFSYINPETMEMDKGLTTHSGCPVIEGEKKIVTQWVRYGVDTENPWDSFNTLGLKKSELDDDYD